MTFIGSRLAVLTGYRKFHLIDSHRHPLLFRISQALYLLNYDVLIYDVVNYYLLTMDMLYWVQYVLHGCIVLFFSAHVQFKNHLAFEINGPCQVVSFPPLPKKNGSGSQFFPQNGYRHICSISNCPLTERSYRRPPPPQTLEVKR